MNLKRRPNKFCTVVSKVSSFVLETLFIVHALREHCSRVGSGIIINIKRFKYGKTGLELTLIWKCIGLKIKIEWNEF